MRIKDINNQSLLTQSLRTGLLLIMLAVSSGVAQAYDCLLDTSGDGNADTNVDTTSSASSNNSSARVACGNNATAGLSATAVGNSASATGNQSLALGRVTLASANFSTAIGSNAQATAAGAIALGANVVASKPNTMTVGVPIELIRNDGTTQVKINEKFSGNSVKTLFNLICDTCTPGFRFNQVLPSNQTWFFRMHQTGNFSVDDPATMTKEAEFRSGGDLKIGGTLIQASSREIKTDFVELDNSVILEKIDQLPVTQWSYKKDEGTINHIGPMAEDFYALFDVGLDNKGLSSVDTAGVALAAIKALKSENDQLKSRISDLESQSAELSDLKALVTRLINKESGTRIARISF